MPGIERKLYRLPEQGKILGVCAGLAEYFDMDVALIRIVFVILALATGGSAILLYIILAIVMPTRDGNQDTIDKKFQQLGDDLKANKALYRIRNYFGVGLIVFGFWLLLIQLFPTLFIFRWNYVWPFALIIFGILIITRRKNG
jgi:phage shock protein C